MPTLADCRKSVAREVAMRRSVYPARVQRGQMSAGAAEHEISAMEQTGHILFAVEQLINCPEPTRKRALYAELERRWKPAPKVLAPSLFDSP
jgi:hypothetical protein